MTDDELVLLARQGDTAAFDQLVVRHQVAVCRAAMAALRNTDEAEEAAQDAFVRAWSQPAPAPVPGVQVPAPPLPPVLPEEVATPRQLVNIRVDLAVIEEGAGEPVRRKEVSLILADRRSGSVRAGGFPVPDKPSLPPSPPDDKFRPPAFTEPTLRVDVLPWLERDGRIRTLVTMRYLSSPHFPREGEQKVEPLLESGKPLVVSQTSSAVSDRKMRVEVTATIL